MTPLNNSQPELTLEQKRAISQFLEDFAAHPSNSNKHRYGLYAYIEEEILSGVTEESPPKAEPDELDRALYAAMITGPNRWAEATINGKLVSYYEIHNPEILKEAINALRKQDRLELLSRIKTTADIEYEKKLLEAEK